MKKFHVLSSLNLGIVVSYLEFSNANQVVMMDLYYVTDVSNKSSSSRSESGYQL